MPGFNQNVKIDIKLKAQTKKAVNKVRGALAEIKTQSELTSDELGGLTADLNEVGDAISDMDSPDIGEGEAKRINKRTDAVKESVDAIKEFREEKNKVAESNVDVKESADASVVALNEEKNSFDKLIQDGSDLTQIKKDVAGANKNVKKMSKESADEIFGESGASRDLAESLDLVKDETDGVSDSLETFRRRTNRSSKSMRAAAEVGDLFEDGLGSLSVNMGAFTIALRNFLTQVPLLLTALGSAGAAAAGAASSFIALAGALGAVIGTGAIAHAQQLKEEYESIESLGDSLTTIMQNLKDTMFDALAPLLESNEVIDLFVDSVNGLAQMTNSLTKEIAGLTAGTKEFNDRVRAGNAPLYTVQQAMSDISNKVGPALRDVFGSMTVAFEELGAEMIAGTARATHGLANIIDFSVQLFDRIEDLSDSISQFGDALAELATLGVRIGGGLLPVFNAFSTVMEDVAAALNEIDGQAVQNAVTFLILFAAANKVSGVLAGMVTILPNIALGLGKVAAAGREASGVMATMKAVTLASGDALGQFLKQSSMLSGMTSLITSSQLMDQQMRKLALSTEEAQDDFEAFAQEMEATSEELRQMAIEGKLAEEQLDDMSDISGLDSDINMSPDDIDSGNKKIDLGGYIPEESFAQRLFEGGDGAAEEASESMSKRIRSKFSSMSAPTMPSPTIPDKGGLSGMQKKMGGVKKSIISAGKAALGAVGKFLSLSWSIAKVGFKAFFTAVKMGAKLVGAMLKAGAAAVIAASKFLYQLLVQRQLNAATIKSTMYKYADAAANLVLAAATAVATAATYALNSALVLATGGVLLLVGVIGGLAVGIISNFNSIKESASNTFGFLKKMLDVVVNVLTTYFIASWNLMVDAFVAVKQGLSPLIDLFTDLFASGEKGSGIMSKFAKVGKVLGKAFSGLQTIFSGLIAAFGGLLAIGSTIVRIALMPIIVTIKILIKIIKTALGFWDSFIGGLLGGGSAIGKAIKGIKALFSGIVDAFKALPKMVERLVNFVIGKINGFLDNVDKVTPGIDISRIDEVDFSSGKGAKTSKSELASDTKSMKESTAEKGDANVTLNEEKNTTNNTTVNADPDEKEAMKRVVKDAMEEANSFERRRNGFTGN